MLFCLLKSKKVVIIDVASRKVASIFYKFTPILYSSHVLPQTLVNFLFNSKFIQEF